MCGSSFEEEALDEKIFCPSRRLREVKMNNNIKRFPLKTEEKSVFRH